MVEAGDFGHVDDSPGQLVEPAFLEVGLDELVQRHPPAVVGRADAAGDGGHRGSAPRRSRRFPTRSSLPAPRFGVARRRRPRAEAADHGPGDHERRARVLEDRRRCSSRRRSGRRTSARSRRGTGRATRAAGTASRMTASAHHRPADADVEEVVDRVAVVLAVLGHEPVELRAGGGDGRGDRGSRSSRKSFSVRLYGPGFCGHLGGQSLVDLGVVVVVEALVDDLAPVGGEVELGRVVLVVAAEAEPVAGRPRRRSGRSPCGRRGRRGPRRASRRGRGSSRTGCP